MIDIAINQIVDSDGKTAFKFPRNGNGYVTGAAYASQKFAKVLLTSPGSDKNFRESGGGLTAIFRKTFAGSTYEQDVESAIINSASTTSGQIKKIQSSQSLPKKDAFVDYTILDVTASRSGSATVSIRVKTFDEVRDISFDLRS